MNILNRMITTMLNKKSDNFQLKTFIDDAQLISQSRSQWLNDKPMMTDDKYDLLKSKIIDQKEAVMLPHYKSTQSLLSSSSHLIRCTIQDIKIIVKIHLFLGTWLLERELSQYRKQHAGFLPCCDSI